MFFGVKSAKVCFMIKKLHLQLNEQHKSFKIDFEQDLSGNLIIISGVNGSGKTQLIDIIRGFRLNDPNQKINRIITQNDAILDDTLIAHKSFRDYSSIGELSSAEVQGVLNERNNIYQLYRDYKLNHNQNQLSGTRYASKKVKSLLVEKFGQQKFDSGSIERDELKEAIPADFIFYQDDIFTNKIGEVFFRYVSMVHNKQAEAGATNRSFDPTSLPIPPWKELNDLFKKLKFDYRFKDFYERINDEISEQPAIYATKEDGSIDPSQKRLLSDLSDGEKALISLTFAVLASEQTHPKVILLDEYDATLNPSLIEAFFIILEDFFVKKDVQVIVVTHSSSTLSLAPEYAFFYEVYKPKGDRPRILQVQRDQYEELAIANKHFYLKVGNQDSRYLEIEAENRTLKDLLEKLQTSPAEQKLQIITEGKNTCHIKKALDILDPKILEKIDIVSGVESKSGKEQLKSGFDFISNMANTHKMLFVWDCDAVGIVEPLKETEYCYKFCFPKNDVNTKMKKGIENVYPESVFTDEVYTTSDDELDDGNKTIRRVDKGKLLTKIEEIKNEVIFENFRTLIEKIKSI